MQYLTEIDPVRAISGYLIGIAILFSSSAFAGNFVVSPIRLELGTGNKSGAITIKNEAENDLNVQIALYEWTQGEDGKDNYEISDDLLYFPRLAKIHAGESRVVRVGLRQMPTAKEEKQYRLYVEELPGQKKQKGMALAVAVRFGVPIFIKPSEVNAKGIIEKIRMDHGKLRLQVRNTGNVHFKITSIKVEAEEHYSDEIAGWYLLQGAAREYEIEVPEEKCAILKQINIKVKTDLMELRDGITVKPELCRR